MSDEPKVIQGHVGYSPDYCATPKARAEERIRLASMVGHSDQTAHDTLEVVAENERLKARVSELEDHIRLREADDDIARSYGRNTDAVRIAKEIRDRRGEEWEGAEV